LRRWVSTARPRYFLPECEFCCMERAGGFDCRFGSFKSAGIEDKLSPVQYRSD
jgi:hypothetical protein